MKRIIVLILVLNSIIGFSQKEKSKIFFCDFVECTYSNKTKDPLVIYNKPEGEEVKVLEVLNSPYCWYKLSISDSKENWLKIENLIVLPGCEENELNINVEKYKGKWVNAKNFEIFFPDNSVITFKLYKEPINSSKVVFKIKGYLKTNIIEIKGLWAKVKFINDNKEIIGWMERKHQCAYPWTNCIVYE